MKFNMSLFERIQNTLNYIEEHLDDVITLEAIEKSALMSKTSFYNLFSQVFDVTIKEYITKRRLSISAYKLVNTDDKILEIALGAMYNSSEAYSRKFKKVYGLSPSSYRKNNQFVELFPKADLIVLMSEKLVYSRGGKTLKDDLGNLKAEINQKLEEYLFDIEVTKVKSGEGDKEKLIIDVKSDKELKSDKNMETKVTQIGDNEFAVVLTI